MKYVDYPQQTDKNRLHKHQKLYLLYVTQNCMWR